MLTKRQLRKKIKSAKNITKITRAMQMVAASKMKRAQNQAQAGRPYAEGIAELSSLLWSQIDPNFHFLLTRKSEKGRELAVIIAPEKGLCGSLVTSLARLISQSLPETKNSEFMAVGKKAKNIVSNLHGSLLADFALGFSAPKYELVPPIARLIAERFLSQDINRVSVFFTGFVNTMVQKPTQKLLLPLSLTGGQPVLSSPAHPYLFEPSAEAITQNLLAMYLELEIYQFLLEAYASEQSARMVAMKNATDNALGLVKDLTQSYNKVRQTGITAELIDLSTASQITNN